VNYSIVSKLTRAVNSVPITIEYWYPLHSCVVICFIAITQTEIIVCQDSVQQEHSDMSFASNNLTNGRVSDVSQVNETTTSTESRQKVDLSRADLPPAVSAPTSCHAKTFLETVYGDFCAVRDSSQEFDDEDSEHDREVTIVTRRIVCVEKTVPRHLASSDAQHGAAAVQLFNSSRLLSHLGSRSNSSTFGRCTVVLFYAPWCTFCVRLAPHYNALARAFPTLDVVAIDAYHFSR